MRNTLLCPFDTGKCIRVWQSRARFPRQEWPGHVYLALGMKDSLPECCLDGRRVHFTGIVFYSEPLLLREWSAKTSHCNGDAGLGEIHRPNICMFVYTLMYIYLLLVSQSQNQTSKTNAPNGSLACLGGRKKSVAAWNATPPRNTEHVGLEGESWPFAPRPITVSGDLIGMQP